MNKQRASAGASRPSQTMNTDFDDWETDPDYVRDMDEMDQRWGGTKRTVGSINMNDLIDQVNKEHNLMREKFQHPSQRLGDFNEEILNRNARDSMHVSEERMSKHSSTQEISRKVYTSASGSESGIKDDISPRSFIERTTSTNKPTIATKPDFINYTRIDSPLKDFSASEPKKLNTSERIVKTESSTSPYKESTTTKRIFKEEKTSSASSSKDQLHESPVYKSIQEKIDAFKKEFEDLENRVSRKSDLSKLIKKSSNYETRQSSTENCIPRNEARPNSTSPSSARSFAKQNDIHVPKTDIKGLSKRFETLCRESDEEFKRRTDARRREFFDQIKNQVRETRKNLEGFDTIDDESESGKPKVYTRSETTKEEIVSKVVKENDKIVENETKRNVERSSSCHGSSDDEQAEPTSIKYLNQHMSKSPTEQFRAKSPIDEIKDKVPIVVPEIKGAGLMARTLYDYQASEDDELSFDVDDLITNIDKVDKEWYKGTITKGGQRQVGLFPANYVKLLNDTSEY